MTRISDRNQIRVIAKNILRLLYENDMNQTELAKLLGVSEQAVTNWVTEKNAPNMANIQRMADHFHVSMMEILEGPQKPSTYQRAWLMDKATNASDDEVAKIAKFWEQMDKESEGNW